MPRQDVPYGGAICRLKERIAEIWDELGKKLHSINGVEGDAAGDVKIVSGDAAIVVTSDQVNHEIEIALDSSQLPAAAVSSVNGQTGAVVLDANDIDAGLTPPGTSVAQDLASTKQQMQVVGGLMQQEILDRQNADSTLQGNINTLSASIPTAAATAVANDPTVAQLATDVPNKVDKITSGSSLKAYTHTGATQGETSVVDGITANSIGIRDANGRMQAADPASGATDKTLVTANWVSQTGDSSPNNVVHRSGNETVNGIKTHTSFIKGCATKILFHTYGLAQNNVCKIADVKNPVSSSQQFKFKLRGWGTSTYGEIEIIVAMKYDGVGSVMTHTIGTSAFISLMSNCIIATEDTANRSISLFYKNPSNQLSSVVTFELTFAGNDAYYGENTTWVNVGSNTAVPEPTSDLLTVVTI